MNTKQHTKPSNLYNNTHLHISTSPPSKHTYTIHYTSQHIFPRPSPVLTAKTQDRPRSPGYQYPVGSQARIAEAHPSHHQAPEPVIRSGDAYGYGERARPWRSLACRLVPVDGRCFWCKAEGYSRVCSIVRGEDDFVLWICVPVWDG